jgi:hypothetical protein
MSEQRDLRNQSRDFETCGNKRLTDLGLNAWGFELFVESYWDQIEEMIIVDGLPPDREPDLVLELTYRGMRITLDPGPGLAAWDRPKEADAEGTS